MKLLLIFLIFSNYLFGDEIRKNDSLQVYPGKILSVGGYFFYDIKNWDTDYYGIEVSYLPNFFWGIVSNFDMQKNNLTINIGGEILSNFVLAYFGANVLKVKDPEDDIERKIKGAAIFFPGIELGLSYNENLKLGLHTSLFINFVILHPYIDYNIYKNAKEIKYGAKFKIGFGKFIGWYLDQAMGI